VATYSEEVKAYMSELEAVKAENAVTVTELQVYNAEITGYIAYIEGVKATKDLALADVKNL